MEQLFCVHWHNHLATGERTINSTQAAEPGPNYQLLLKRVRSENAYTLKECAFDVKLECDVSVFLFLDINLSGYEIRPSQLAELSHSEFDTELFSHSAYVNFFVTFATKKSYLTFCDKMRRILIEMDREGRNKRKIRKCRE